MVRGWGRGGAGGGGTHGSSGVRAGGVEGRQADRGCRWHRHERKVGTHAAARGMAGAAGKPQHAMGEARCCKVTGRKQRGAAQAAAAGARWMPHGRAVQPGSSQPRRRAGQAQAAQPQHQCSSRHPSHHTRAAAASSPPVPGLAPRVYPARRLDDGTDGQVAVLQGSTWQYNQAQWSRHRRRPCAGQPASPPAPPWLLSWRQGRGQTRASAPPPRPNPTTRTRACHAAPPLPTSTGSPQTQPHSTQPHTQCCTQLTCVLTRPIVTPVKPANAACTALCASTCTAAGQAGRQASMMAQLWSAPAGRSAPGARRAGRRQAGGQHAAASLRPAVRCGVAARHGAGGRAAGVGAQENKCSQKEGRKQEKKGSRKKERKEPALQ